MTIYYGVITTAGEQRLFYADATIANKKNLDLKTKTRRWNVEVCIPTLERQCHIVKGRHADLPLPNTAYYMIVGANLSVRPRLT